MYHQNRAERYPDKGSGKWANKLFILPEFVQKLNTNIIDNDDLSDAIKITTFFLNRYVSSIGIQLPASRDRFTNKLKKVRV